MKLSDEKRIEALREDVWQGLNDVDILKQAIPGCDSLERVGDNQFEAEVRAKVGPVKAKFKGNVTLSDLNPPESYRISGEGKGGAAGFAKGGATVTLEEDGDATILKYEVDADVGGKLAQIGGRLIEGTSKKLAGEFFDNFEVAIKPGSTEQTAGDDTASSVGAETPITQPSQNTEHGSLPAEAQSSKNKIWLILGVIFVVGALALTIMQ